jgi:hypothetical protein
MKRDVTRSQALPGNADPEALPPIFRLPKRGRASGHRLRGRAWEPVKTTNSPFPIPHSQIEFTIYLVVVYFCLCLGHFKIRGVVNITRCFFL